MSEDLPFGSRGGMAIRHHFPVDGEYSIKIKLQTNLYDYVAGSAEPHRLEVRVDGARVEVFTVGGEDKGTPAPASFAGAIFGSPEWERLRTRADEELEVPLHRQGRHARRRRGVRRRVPIGARRRAQPPPGRLSAGDRRDVGWARPAIEQVADRRAVRR